MTRSHVKGKVKLSEQKDMLTQKQKLPVGSKELQFGLHTQDKLPRVAVLPIPASFAALIYTTNDQQPTLTKRHHLHASAASPPFTPDCRHSHNSENLIGRDVATMLSYTRELKSETLTQNQTLIRLKERSAI